MKLLFYHMKIAVQYLFQNIQKLNLQLEAMRKSESVLDIEALVNKAIEETELVGILNSNKLQNFPQKKSFLCFFYLLLIVLKFKYLI